MTEIIIIVICVLCSAFFSASETAYSTLNVNRLKLLAEGGKRSASKALKLSQKYDELLSTILVGNNIVNIALASVSTILFVRLMGDPGASVSTAVITAVVLVFGEVTPKSIAKDYPEKFAAFAAPALSVLIVVFKPLNFLFSKWKLLIGRLFGAKESKNVTPEELLLMLEEVEKEGSLDKSEGELLINAVEFADCTVGEILTHRTDMAAADAGWDKARIAEVFSESGHTRLPVYEGNPDNIVGILHYKDFFIASGISPKPLAELLKPPLFAEAGEKLPEVLKLMKRHKTHLCVVVDEYGGTSGIVTMEDILEELVGEIWDEHDEVVEYITPCGDGSYVVSALTNIEEFAEFFGVRPETESVSVGGWVMEMLGRIPAADDAFTFDGLHIEVLTTDGRAAAEVLVIGKGGDAPDGGGEGQAAAQ